MSWNRERTRPFLLGVIAAVAASLLVGALLAASGAVSVSALSGATSECSSQLPCADAAEATSRERFGPVQ